MFVAFVSFRKESNTLDELPAHYSIEEKSSHRCYYHIYTTIPQHALNHVKYIVPPLSTQYGHLYHFTYLSSVLHAYSLSSAFSPFYCIVHTTALNTLHILYPCTK